MVDFCVSVGFTASGFFASLSPKFGVPRSAALLPAVRKDTVCLRFALEAPACKGGWQRISIRIILRGRLLFPRHV